MSWFKSKADKRHKETMAKLSELAGKLDEITTSLDAVAAQLEKARVEIIAALGDVEIPQAAMDKLNALTTIATSIKAASQGLDDLNADAPTP